MNLHFHSYLKRILLPWYKSNGRDLPWRNTKDPYAIWVSEIMLQQTQVERVKGFYERFLVRFPTILSLAKAEWSQVLSSWRGLGYYRRARNLHAAAKMMVKSHNGHFPISFDELKKLPGIGDYTAAAIASFAFGDDFPALDTNLRRVFGRILGEKKWYKLSEKGKFELVSSFIPHGQGAAFNHAFMDIGAIFCSVLAPKCPECPLQKHCSFALHNDGFQPKIRQKQRFRSLKKFPKTALKVAVGVIIHKGKVLISKRLKHVAFGDLWEFPGGKLQENEDERSCLKREIKEELGIEVAVRPAFYRALSQFEGQVILLSFHRCSVLLGRPRALEVQEFKWVLPQELLKFAFPPVNMEVIRLLQQKKAMFRS